MSITIMCARGLACAIGLAAASATSSTARVDESRTLGGDPPTLSGRPSDVHDGDTFRFGQTRIRVYGVDAPELETRYGEAARRALITAIGSGQVACRDTGARSYRRVVARCINAQGGDLSAIMARSGWAVDCGRFHAGRPWPTNATPSKPDAACTPMAFSRGASARRMHGATAISDDPAPNVGDVDRTAQTKQ